MVSVGRHSNTEIHPSDTSGLESIPHDTERTF